MRQLHGSRGINKTKKEMERSLSPFVLIIRIPITKLRKNQIDRIIYYIEAIGLTESKYEEQVLRGPYIKLHNGLAIES